MLVNKFDSRKKLSAIILICYINTLIDIKDFLGMMFVFYVSHVELTFKV
jgi:hypothetical protein